MQQFAVDTVTDETPASFSPSDESPAVLSAARWLAGQAEPPQPIIPELRKRFALSALEASKACVLARTFRKAQG